jgi:hypothetical protein
MNKSIPAADPAMKSHHDIDISLNLIFFNYKNVQNEFFSTINNIE